MTDYDRIAAVIRYVDAHRLEQPGLNTLAEQVGLSSSHLHRLFVRWAGLTPKEFLQSLTLSCAKERLLAGNSVLESALEAGLSGPGRLHDLCIKLESATPGEIKNGGSGWVIHAGCADSPFGPCLIAESPRGICHLSFDPAPAWNYLQTIWPNAELVRDDQRAAALCARMFHRQPTEAPSSLQPMKLFVRGTAFQVVVWQALLRIPEGRLASYGHLAKAVGNPRASRAVGTAIGNNPVAFLIPCHRIIRETGALGGYRWGPIRKKAIQAWEMTGR